MDYNEINFGIDALVSIVFGTGGAIGVWFTLKGRVDILKIELENTRETSKKEVDSFTARLDQADKERKDLNRIIESNKNANEIAMSGIKELILQMKIDIIQEIHAKK